MCLLVVCIILRQEEIIVDKIRQRLAEIERKLATLEEAQERDEEVLAEIQQIMEELVRKDAATLGQEKAAIERINGLLKKRRGKK